MIISGYYVSVLWENDDYLRVLHVIQLVSVLWEIDDYLRLFRFSALIKPFCLLYLGAYYTVLVFNDLKKLCVQRL